MHGPMNVKFISEVSCFLWLWSLVQLMEDAVEKPNREAVFVPATVRFMLLLKCYCSMNDRLVAFLNVNGTDCSFNVKYKAATFRMSNSYVTLCKANLQKCLRLENVKMH